MGAHSGHQGATGLRCERREGQQRGLARRPVSFKKQATQAGMGSIGKAFQSEHGVCRLDPHRQFALGLHQRGQRRLNRRRKPCRRQATQGCSGQLPSQRVIQAALGRQHQHRLAGCHRGVALHRHRKRTQAPGVIVGAQFALQNRRGPEGDDGGAHSRLPTPGV